MLGEDTRKPRRKLKYPDKEAVIAVLEEREVQGEENFPSVLRLKNGFLYSSALKFDVELPMKRHPWVRYYPGDLVLSQNLKAPDIYEKIGKVLESSEKEVRVTFRERGHITRVYRKWENFNNITLYVRSSSVPVGSAEGQTILI